MDENGSDLTELPPLLDPIAESPYFVAKLALEGYRERLIQVFNFIDDAARSVGLWIARQSCRDSNTCNRLTAYPACVTFPLQWKKGNQAQ